MFFLPSSAFFNQRLTKKKKIQKNRRRKTTTTEYRAVVVIVTHTVGYRCSNAMSSRSRFEYLRDELFPRAVADGAFGPGAAYETFAVNEDATAADQFCSDVMFGTVTVRGGEGGEAGGEAGGDGGEAGVEGGGGDGEADVCRRHRVVIKFKNADSEWSAKVNMHQKFHNEHVFYALLLPELARRARDPAAARALFPRFVYSNATPTGKHDGGHCGGEQVIVVADAAPDGYRPSDGRVVLDADHVMLALRKLGNLHGLSYNVKAHPDGRAMFAVLLGALAETQWFDGYWFMSPRFLSGNL